MIFVSFVLYCKRPGHFHGYPRYIFRCFPISKLPPHFFTCNTKLKFSFIRFTWPKGNLVHIKNLDVQFGFWHRALQALITQVTIFHPKIEMHMLTVILSPNCVCVCVCVFFFFAPMSVFFNRVISFSHTAFRNGYPSYILLTYLGLDALATKS